jgi:Mrp family chromosome partitioning ATPase
VFDLKAGPGLAEVLRGECSPEGATVKDREGGLFILPAGSVDASSPSHLFAGPRFRELLAQLRSQYDKVVIDVAPVLCASETLLIAKDADGVLMCARYAHSRLGQIREAYDRLVAADVKIAAAVLYGVPVRQSVKSHSGYAPI